MHRAKLEEILMLIELCRVVENQGSNPFEIDIKKALEKLRIHLPEWKLLGELLIDAEALYDISGIIKLQEEWVKYRASALYIDPDLIELKIRVAPSEELAHAILKSWYPITSIDQLTSSKLKESIDYWNQHLTLEERYREETHAEIHQIGTLNVKDLIQLRALSQEEFSSRLQDLGQELEIIEGRREAVESDRGIDYWDFIYRNDSFSDTVLRAYLTSFLVTEGYALLSIDPLEEEILLSSTDKLQTGSRSNPYSIAIPLSHKSWRSSKRRNESE